MDKFHAMAAQASATINSHPGTSAAAAWGASLIAFLQSSQQVASTLIALVTSLAALTTAVMALRNAWRNRNKSKE
jgi:hypothetical protein